MRVFEGVKPTDISVNEVGELIIQQGEHVIFVPVYLVPIFVKALNEQTCPPKTRRDL